MGNVIVNLLPMILGSAIVPMIIIIVIIMLMGEKGTLKVAAFIAAVCLVRLLQGFLFGYVLGSGQQAADSSTAEPSTIVSTLLILVGILFAVSGIKAFRHEDDPDDPPPKWMTMVETLTPVKAFGVGALWILVGAKLWAFTLAALAVIRDANLTSTENAISYFIYMLGCVSLLLIPLIYRLVSPESSKTTLASLRAWLEQHNRVIMIIMSAIFGTVFLLKGITGLLG